MRVTIAAGCLVTAGTVFGAKEEVAGDVEWLMRPDTTNSWKITQVYPGLSSTVRLETVPSAARIESFSRLVVLRGDRVLGFVRVVSPAPSGFSVGSLGRTLRVSLLRHGDILRTFELETDKRRTWQDLTQAAQQEVMELIARLGDKSYARREAATRELKTRGREVLSKLRQTVGHADPEVRARAKDVGIAISAREYVVPPKLTQVLQRRSGREKPITRQGFLGVSIADVQQGQQPGALITQVLKDSPAERAGICLQDVILAIDAQLLDDSTDVLEIVSAKEPGSIARLKMQRGDEIIEINATLASRPIPLP